MKILVTLFRSLMLVTLLLLTAAFAQAQTSRFTYQGRLTDGGTPANGIYDLQFTLYDAVTGGTPQGSPNTVTKTEVNVASGIFTVQLDFSANPFTSGVARFLEIRVKHPADVTYTTLGPRQQLTASPFSVRTISAGAADSLSSACVGCVTDANITSVAGDKVIGTVANAANATTANTATTAGTVTGLVAIPNGGTGSSTQNFVDLTTAQTIAGGKTFSANLRTSGLIRAGSETGTSEVPALNALLGTYSGVVTRRIHSNSQTAGRVAARTNFLRLERDGSPGGWRIANDEQINGTIEAAQIVHCLGISNGGAVVPARLHILNQPAGTTPLYTNAQDIEYMQCSFGNVNNMGHQTQVVLQRFASGPLWTGTLTSTFNQ